MMSSLDKLRQHFLDYVGTIYNLPPEEDRFPRKIRTAIRTVRPPYNQEVTDATSDEPEESCEEETGDDEDAGWVFMEDMRINIAYDAFSDYWIVGYYPIDDVGIEVISRNPERAIREMIDCLARQWSFLAGDVEECVTDLDKEIALFVGDPKEAEIIGWN
jgi:hypothetical protein